MKLNSRSIQAIIVGLIFLSVSTIQCNWFKKDEEPPAPDYGIRVYPENGAVIWGYQILRIAFNSSFDIQVSDIKISHGGITESLIRDDNPISYFIGEYTIELNAESIPENSVEVIIEFMNNVVSPIIYTYTVNHMAVINIVGEISGNQAFLDASTSEDPDGQTLTYTWETNTGSVSGPQLETNLKEITEEGVLISVSDGTSLSTDLVYYDSEESEFTLAKDHMKCFLLEIDTTGYSECVPLGTPLGPTISPGTQLLVDANVRLTRDYVIGYKFEVVATLQYDTTVLDEGQDVAASATVVIEGSLQNVDIRGSRRQEQNRSLYLPGLYVAPFPTTIPPPSEPVLIQDSYDHHPRPATYEANTSTGVSTSTINSKKMIRFDKYPTIIWFDRPGTIFKAGADLSKGRSYNAYFRSWMMPDVTKCQKYFMVQIEIDSTGKVTRNRLVIF